MTTTNRPLGKKVWAFAAGHIPLWSTGKEPAFTSHDKVSVLNTAWIDAAISISIYYEHENPVEDHAIYVPARRVRKIRFNDLINPLPIPLDKPFAFVLRSSVEVIVQFSRADTGSRQTTGFCVTPFPCKML
jgi:hypothetical protein